MATKTLFWEHPADEVWEQGDRGKYEPPKRPNWKLLDAVIYTDGSCEPNPGPAAYAFVVVMGDKVVHREARYMGAGTNNEAEFMGVLEAMRFAKERGLQRIEIRTDSQLFVNCASGYWGLYKERLCVLMEQVDALKRKFKGCAFRWIPRAYNTLADELAEDARAFGAVKREGDVRVVWAWGKHEPTV